MTRLSLAAITLTVLACQPVHAQSETPTQFAERYFSLMQRGDWNGVARLMHPEALRTFKSLFTPIVAADSARAVASGLFGMSSRAEFERADPAVVFASLMRQMAVMAPEFAQIIGGARISMIGALPERGTDVQHVVYRMTTHTEGIEVEKLGVMAVRRHGTSWAAMLSGDVKGLAAALAKRRR